ncbi:hypothetical protein [Methylomicrobium lacus]|uniref:hypothetical protein n=1 Tax=Methylomicrobium lacus TaxID=136992 RepID=UPI0035A85300
MSLTKTMLLLAGLGYALAAPLVQAASPTPSVAGTTWNLEGKFKGKAKVKCQVGGSHSVPIQGPRVLSASISFDDGEVTGDNEGTFSWTNDSLTQKPASGRWTQDGTKLELEFDHWYDSPMGAFAFALAQVPSDFDFSQVGIEGSAGGFKLTKLDFSGSINKKLSKIKVAESLGFSFDASASGYGGANACTFEIKSLGRSFKGVPVAPAS